MPCSAPSRWIRQRPSAVRSSWTERRPTTFDIFLYAKQVGDWLDWKSGPSATIKSPSLHPRKPDVGNFGRIITDMSTAEEANR